MYIVLKVSNVVLTVIGETMTVYIPPRDRLPELVPLDRIAPITPAMVTEPATVDTELTPKWIIYVPKGRVSDNGLLSVVCAENPVMIPWGPVGP